jgi:hypothetical protein
MKSTYIHSTKVSNYCHKTDHISGPTPGVDLQDGIMKKKENSIQNRMRMENLVDDGHTFHLNVKQLYKPTEG